MLVLTSNTAVGNAETELLCETIYQSNLVKKHFDFYQWQQKFVNKFIPHNALIAAWGDFERGSLQFDVCSSIPEIHSQQYKNGCDELMPLMTTLFNQWEDNHDHWFFQEEFKLWELGIDFSPSDKLLTELLAMRTVLVYGLRDKRSNTNVLYAFLNSHLMYETQTTVVNAIMPHLDAALRRVDCLPVPKNSVSESPIIETISERESAVLGLVIKGETNTAIAEKLFISVNTVKNHLKNIYKKMDVSSRAQAVAKYLELSHQAETTLHKNNVKTLSVA